MPLTVFPPNQRYAGIGPILWGDLKQKELDMKVLIVLTSHDRLGDTGKKTGFWAYLRVGGGGSGA
jgi:hypothetical protein